MSLRLILLAGSIFLAAASSAGAACSPDLPLQSSTVPSLPGRAVYQGVVDNGTTHIYLFDFSTHMQTDLSWNWNVINPMNPAFSPDGKKIVFYACAALDAQNQCTKYDVYIWMLETKALYNITTGFSGRFEDPKWMPDGKGLILKQDGNIALLSVGFDASNHPTLSSAPQALTSGGTVGNAQTESWAPSVSPDSKYVYYTQGVLNPKVVNSTSQVYRLIIASKHKDPFSVNGSYAYYPVARDLTTVLYSGWMMPAWSGTMEEKQPDQVMEQVPTILGTNKYIVLSANECKTDNSDPAAVDSDFYLFSSDSQKLSSGGKYRPVLALLAGPFAWDLSRIGLGAGIVGDIKGLNYTVAR